MVVVLVMMIASSDVRNLRFRLFHSVSYDSSEYRRIAAPDLLRRRIDLDRADLEDLRAGHSTTDDRPGAAWLEEQHQRQVAFVSTTYSAEPGEI
jgi:hypothetical protein